MPAQMQTSSRITLIPRITGNLHGLPEAGRVTHCLYLLQHLCSTVQSTSVPQIIYLYDARQMWTD